MPLDAMSVGWDGSAGDRGPVSKMAHTYGWQVGAGSCLGAQLGLLARGPDSSPRGPLHTGLLGLPYGMVAGFQE